MVGGEFSLADIALTSPFVNFALVGEVLETACWQSLAGSVERVHGMPCYAPVVKADLEGQFARFVPKVLVDR